MLRYDFLARGKLHDIQVEHRGGAWRCLCDGEVVAGKRHNKTNPLTPAKYVIDFLCATGLPAPESDAKAELRAVWQIKGAKWNYEMKLAGTLMQPAWSKVSGEGGSSPVELYGPPEENPNPVKEEPPVEEPMPAVEEPPPSPPPAVEEPPPEEEKGQLQASMEPPPPEEEPKDGVLEDWEKAWSPADSRYYYFNHKTRTRQWERPDFDQEPKMQVPPNPEELPAGWEMAWSPADRAYYFYNTHTNETKWEIPEEEKPAEKQSDQAEFNQAVFPEKQGKSAEESYEAAIQEHPNPDSECCGYGCRLW
jgi:hypothetical protein